jgi:protein-S-isoprenylcysteine O-methyltransferase Ste14
VSQVLVAGALPAARRDASSVTTAPPARAFIARAGHLLFRWRDAVFPLVLLTVGFGTRPRIVADNMRLDNLMDLGAFHVAFCGQALRVLVVGLAYITRGGLNRQVWAYTLVDGGMFGHCRNPLYIGNLLIIAGLALVHNGWAMYLILLPFFVVTYACIVRAEEEYLRGRFGDAYVSYCQRVPRWVPSLRGLSQTMNGTHFDWWKVVRKEYGTAFAWISGMLALRVWEHQSAGATPLSPVELRFIVVTWGASAVAYLVARTLKLRGRLGTG